jgi:hypothetical protein
MGSTEKKYAPVTSKSKTAFGLFFYIRLQPKDGNYITVCHNAVKKMEKGNNTFGKCLKEQKGQVKAIRSKYPPT